MLTLESLYEEISSVLSDGIFVKKVDASNKMVLEELDIINKNLPKTPLEYADSCDRMLNLMKREGALSDSQYRHYNNLIESLLRDNGTPVT